MMARRFNQKIQELRRQGKNAQADKKLKRRERLRKAGKGILSVVKVATSVAGDAVPGAKTIGRVAGAIPINELGTVNEQIQDIVPLGRTLVETVMTLWEALEALYEAIRK